MSLEQTIRDTLVSESMDLDARLQQLVRAGLMPQNTLPLLRKSIAKVQMGLSLQGPERDVMATFINSMMYIVLGDDTIFNKARAGAKMYATEAKEKQEYDYEGDMAMSQLKSIIANSQKMHDMLGADTNLPEWVQSKITLAEDYITTAANYMQGEMNEAVGDITVKKVSAADAYKKHTGQMTKKSKVPVDPKTGKTLYQKVTSEEVEDLEETAKIVAHLQKRYGDNIRKSHVASAAKDFGVDASKLSKAVRKKLGKSMLDEEEQIDEISRGMISRYQAASKEEGRKNRLSPSGASSKVTKRTQGADLAMRKSLSAVTGKKLAKVPATNEEVDQIDELSKDTLKSYLDKKKVPSGTVVANTKDKDSMRKYTNRVVGGVRASRKLTKESRKTEALADITAIKQMNESYKTTFDAALEQYGIKSPSELDEEKRKEFFNFVDQEYKKGDK